MKLLMQKNEEMKKNGNYFSGQINLFNCNLKFKFHDLIDCNSLIDL